MLYAWYISDTINGEIDCPIFCSFNLDLAIHFLKSNCRKTNYECLVLYRDKFDEKYDKKLLCE